MTKKNPNSITFGAERLTIEDVVAISQGAKASMNTSEAFTSKSTVVSLFRTPIERRRRDLMVWQRATVTMYRVAIPPNFVDELPPHLTRFHGCGLYEILSHEQSRAVLATRLCSLSQGVSGVTLRFAQPDRYLINQDISPRIPQEAIGWRQWRFNAAVLSGGSTDWWAMLSTKAKFALPVTSTKS